MSYKLLLAHQKLRIAIERSRWRDHKNRPGRRTLWNSRLNVGIGLHRELCRHSIERDAGRSSQTVPQDEDARAHRSNHGHGFHQRAKVVREFENLAIVVDRSVGGDSVKAAIGALNQRANWWGADPSLEGIERRVRA